MAQVADDSFVHLHVHTEYSMLDRGRPARRPVHGGLSTGSALVAMSDHGNLYGAFGSTPKPALPASNHHRDGGYYAPTVGSERAP